MMCILYILYSLMWWVGNVIRPITHTVLVCLYFTTIVTAHEPDEGALWHTQFSYNLLLSELIFLLLFTLCMLFFLSFLLSPCEYHCTTGRRECVYNETVLSELFAPKFR